MPRRLSHTVLALPFLAALAPPAAGQSQLAKFLASDGTPGDYYGHAVSLSGDLALVGAYADSDAGAVAGSAYVCRRQGASWTEEQKLVAGDAAPGDQFGYAVSLSGETALVGSYLDDASGTDSGSAYVYEGDGTSSWVFQAKLTASDGTAADQFGHSVALDGERAVVGARFHDGPGANSGAAYVFERQGVAWVETAKLAGSDATGSEQFGYSVALFGDRILAGAIHDDDEGIWAGAVYVFEKQGGVWVETDKLIASDIAPGDRFGNAVSLWNDRALIGAYFENGGSVEGGSAYVFEKQGADWIETEKLTAAVGGDHFGHSVSLWNEHAMIGAPFDDDGGANAGAAYLYERRGAALGRDREADGVRRGLRGPVRRLGLDLGRQGTGGSLPERRRRPQRGVRLRGSGSAPRRRSGTRRRTRRATPPRPRSWGLHGPRAWISPRPGTSWRWSSGTWPPSTPSSRRGRWSLVGGARGLPAPGEVRTPRPSWTKSIPNDPSLAGFAVYTQAVHVVGVDPFALSNAMDLVVGY